MASVSIRQASADDNLDVMSVKRAAIQDGADERYSAEQVAAWTPGTEELHDYEATLEDEGFLVLVAEIGSAVVGFAILDVESGALLALYIQPGQRGTGIGSTLLGHVETSASMNGADTVALLASHNAVGFYERHGYERVETVEREIGGETMPFVSMEKGL
jgi:putative acetyltransferase